MRVDCKQKAFSLIELLLVLGIISLIVLFADSTLYNLFQRQSIQSATQRFFVDLQFARSESIKRNTQVHLCPSIDGKQCANEWQMSYIIFLKNKDSNAENEILRVNRLSNNFKVTHSNHPLITYNGDGSCLTRTTLWFQNEASKQKVVIFDSGRARVETIYAI